MSNEILAPAGYIPRQALSFAASDGSAVAVDPGNPLPVSAPANRAALSTPLSGSTSASTTVGPFVPQLGREIVLTLSGTFGGTVSLLRSTDGGATKLPATLGGSALSWSAALNEIVWIETEAAATLYLQLGLTSGTIAYRVAQ